MHSVLEKELSKAVSLAPDIGTVSHRYLTPTPWPAGLLTADFGNMRALRNSMD